VPQKVNRYAKTYIKPCAAIRKYQTYSVVCVLHVFVYFASFGNIFQATTIAYVYNFNEDEMSGDNSTNGIE
jgi:hypothetical protein